MKRCSTCKEKKSFSEFNRHTRNKDGLSYQCRSCHSKTRNAARDKRVADNLEQTCKCKNCGIEFTYKKYGRTKIYCNNKCKDEFYKKSDKWKEWYDNRLPKRMLYNAKTRAKKLNLDFNIDESDCIVPEYCPILGLKLEYGSGKGYKPSSPSLDRVVPSKGYVKGNVRVISGRANLLKNDATIEEIERILQYMKEHDQTTILEEAF